MEVETVPVLAMTDGELELFESTLLGPDAVRYFWCNAVSDHGVFFSIIELELILSRIGSTPSWDFVRIRKEGDDGLWAQTCGRASDGLAVEINGPLLVAPVGAPSKPRIEVGTPTWRYWAAPAELHDVATAAELLLTWIVDAETVEGFEVREPYLRVPRKN